MFNPVTCSPHLCWLNFNVCCLKLNPSINFMFILKSPRSLKRMVVNFRLWCSNSTMLRFITKTGLLNHFSTSSRGVRRSRSQETPGTAVRSQKASSVEVVEGSQWDSKGKMVDFCTITGSRRCPSWFSKLIKGHQ
jgi:hypothetical protein